MAFSMLDCPVTRLNRSLAEGSLPAWASVRLLSRSRALARAAIVSAWMRLRSSIGAASIRDGSPRLSRFRPGNSGFPLGGGLRGHLGHMPADRGQDRCPVGGGPQGGEV